MNVEMAIRAGAICLPAEFVLQHNQPVGDLMLERGCAARSALATRGQPVRPPQIVPGGDCLETQHNLLVMPDTKELVIPCLILKNW
jgi:hypothetical protein